MSRHRKFHSSRSKAVALVAAGAFTVAAAASAAATWSQGPSGSQPGRAPEAGARPAVTDQLTWPQALPPASASLARPGGQVRLDDILIAAQWTAIGERTARHAAAKAAVRAAVAAAKSVAQPAAQPAASAQPQPAGPATTAVVASGAPEQIAQAMLGSFGWPAGQFSCLDPLWAHESGWVVTAYNAGTGAYGIPQALPGSKMASAGPDWQTDAATQIRWGLEYIKAIYGSPCAAWDHEQATGWY